MNFTFYLPVRISPCLSNSLGFTMPEVIVFLQPHGTGNCPIIKILPITTITSLNNATINRSYWNFIKRFLKIHTF